MMSLFSFRPRQRAPLLLFLVLVGVERYMQRQRSHVDLFRFVLSFSFLFLRIHRPLFKNSKHLQLTMRSLLPSLRRSPAPGLRLGTNLSDLGAASNARARTETAPPKREERRAMLVELCRARDDEEALPIETELCIVPADSKTLTR